MKWTPSFGQILRPGQRQFRTSQGSSRRRGLSHTYKSGYGGGTIARYFNQMNMEVTDWGVGILSMHSTYDVASKADLRALYKGFVAFFKS